MRLRTKINLVLLIFFACSLVLFGLLSYRVLSRSVRDEVVQKAGIMMEAALSVRGYTVRQVKPLLEMQLRRAFQPQSVPAYAATEIFNNLRRQYQDYTYKEATLNPTNLRDRATDWEADIIEAFRNDPTRKEIIGERQRPTGPALYLARPIQIQDKGCLVCHGVIDHAPATMVKLYGTANGFGWKHQEIVGAQIVSVPMEVPIRKANTIFLTFMGTLTGIFAIIFIILNLVLSRMVVKPLTTLSTLADEISETNRRKSLHILGNL